jgi:signal transduction histidine kinase/ActR/RegA family two-component response regulator
MAGPTLEELLTDRRNEIVARFVAEVRQKELPPAGISRSLLVDHIPKFLDEILEELRQEPEMQAGSDALDKSTTARKHGGQRWSLGYDLEALMREYGILRHCILEEAIKASAQVSVAEIDLLAKCLYVGATEAAAAYVRRRDEELAFLAEAGKLLSSSLERMPILTRLTRLVVPRFADWSTVYVAGVEDTLVAHVDPAKLPALRELHRRLSAGSAGSGVYMRAISTREPELVPESRDELLESFAPNVEEQALLREVGAASWMVIPLRGKDEAAGVMVLGYGDPKKHYSRSDLAVMQDLAERAAAALENARVYELSQEARLRVETATRAKDEFVAMVSHELRTPLNAILGWLRLYRSGTLPVEKRDHAFGVVERNANTLNGLVADLLDVSRIITGNIRLNISQVDLANVVELALEGVRPALEAKRIDVRLNLGAGNALMRGDGERLQQVAWNLLSNAIKFTPSDGRIDVSLRQVDSGLELEVRDTGSGIAAEFLPHVFESFRQWESGSTRRHGGLGIGLSIALHIVELHGGSISAASEGLGKGATFIVRLPAATVGGASVEATPLVTEATAEAAPLSGGLEGLRVLVIDDDEDARELVRLLLESAGIEVRTAESAERGLTALEEFEPHVLVSDIAMPSEDGYSLIRRIRLSSAKTARTPAIALTAYVRSDDRNRALVEGFNIHLGKPVQPAELLTAIAELAGRPPTLSSPSSTR